MKKVLVVGCMLSVALSFSSFGADVQLDDGPNASAGQARDAKASLLSGSVRSTIRDIKVANKEGTTLAGQQAHQLATADLILAGWATFEKERDVHQANAAKQNDYARQVDPLIDAYNAQCNREVDQAMFDWCNGEKSRLQPYVDKVNTWRDEVDANKDRLTKNIDLLNQAGVDMDKEGNDIHQRGLKYMDKYDMLVQRVKDFETQLAALQDKFDACKPTQGTTERVHEVCGSMFDGNIVQTTETNYPIPDPTFKFYNGPVKCTPEKTFCYSAIK